MALRVRYYFTETAQGLRRNGLVAFAAISTCFVALFLVGGALLFQREVGHLIEINTQNVEVSVFLQKGISADQQSHIGDLLTQMPEVKSVDFESQQEAYERFKVLFANQQALIENVSPDALPSSFKVQLKDPSEFELVAARLKGQPGIEHIRDNRDVLRRLFAIIGVFQWGVIVVAGVMLVSAAVLIGNTVRLAVFNRRKEIGIMRLVGATNWHIRVPFLIEGIIEGLLGAGVAAAGLFIMKVALIDPLQGKLSFFPLISTPDVIFAVYWIVPAGVLVAAVASMFAMRRFLDV